MKCSAAGSYTPNVPKMSTIVETQPFQGFRHVPFSDRQEIAPSWYELIRSWYFPIFYQFPVRLPEYANRWNPWYYWAPAIIFLVAGEGLARIAARSAVLRPLSVAALDTRLLERPPDVLASRRGLCRFKSSPSVINAHKKPSFGRLYVHGCGGRTWTFGLRVT